MRTLKKIKASLLAACIVAPAAHAVVFAEVYATGYAFNQSEAQQNAIMSLYSSYKGVLEPSITGCTTFSGKFGQTHWKCTAKGWTNYPNPL